MPSRDEQRLLDNLNRAQHGGEGAGGVFLVLLRLFLGFKFLQAGWQRLPLLGDPAPLRRQIALWAADQAHPFWGYQEFLKNVVLPQIGLWNTLLILGELMVGFLLLAGALSRLAALIALGIAVNHWFAVGHGRPELTGQSEALALIALVVCLAGAGRTFGLDTFLSRRFPRALFW